MGRPVAILILLTLTSCGSSSSGTKPTTTATTPTQPPPPKVAVARPDDPKLAFAKLVLADLAAGNVEALVKLADPLAFRDKTADCKATPQARGLNVDPKQAPVHAARASLTYRIEQTRGLKIDVLALAPPQGESRTTKAGSQLSEGCVAKRDFVQEPISLKIRAQRDNKPAVEQTVTIQGVELDGRWYLVEVPSRIQEKATSKAAAEAIAKMSQFTDAMCKCKDRACADKVNEDLMKWGTEMAKTADRDERPDPELAKQASEIMTRYTECMTKAMMATSGD
jgi:hypothetical protein